MVVVEKDPKCKLFPDLKQNQFLLNQSQKVMEVWGAVRLRIIDVDEKFRNQPFFLFTKNKLPSKGTPPSDAELSIKDIYEAEKDPEDGLLYFKYSNFDPFGSD
jgi:DNA-directed RNA polymerase subunit E'/Rpb7